MKKGESLIIMRIDNPLHCIGNTPLLRLSGMERKYGLAAELYAKLEMQNPAGSVKDRAALFMVEDAQRRGLLLSGGTVVEATSGNTGIGLAYVCALKGYRFYAVMPNSASEERKLLMKAYGAEVVLTDGALGMAGAIEKAKELCAELNAYMPDQFSNPANAEAHYQTTGVELYRDLPEIDVLVSGIGSGGTISGCGRYLKEQNPKVKVVGVEPSASPFLTKGEKGLHQIEGIGAGFCPNTLCLSKVDKVVCVDDDQAYAFAKEVALTDGVFAGISSGAALAASVALASEKDSAGQKIAVIFPDGGDRYLSKLR